MPHRGPVRVITRGGHELTKRNEWIVEVPPGGAAHVAGIATIFVG